jgi:hypothetical protein
VVYWDCFRPDEGRFEMLKTLAIATALFGGIAAPAAFSAKQTAAPQLGRKPQATSSQSFAATCSAGAAKVDSRAEPGWVGQSFAGDGCAAPSLPRIVDGYTASRAQIWASKAAQKKYFAQADAYQRCIVDFVSARRAATDKGAKPMAVALVVIENHRLAASQTSKQQFAAQVTETIREYNEQGSEDCK